MWQDGDVALSAFSLISLGGKQNARSSRIYDPLWLYRRLCQGNPRSLNLRLKSCRKIQQKCGIVTGEVKGLFFVFSFCFWLVLLPFPFPFPYRITCTLYPILTVPTSFSTGFHSSSVWFETPSLVCLSVCLSRCFGNFQFFIVVEGRRRSWPVVSLAKLPGLFLSPRSLSRESSAYQAATTNVWFVLTFVGFWSRPLRRCNLRSTRSTRSPKLMLNYCKLHIDSEPKTSLNKN